MKHNSLFILLVLLLILACHPFAFAEDSTPFLAEGETVYEDASGGIWRYNSPTLQIEIVRHEDSDIPLVWFVAHIYTKPDSGEVFRMIPFSSEKRMKRTNIPSKIANDNQVVFAMTGDFAHHRIRNNSRPGIIIRDGEIFSSKTRTAKSTKFPPEDNLALFSDGAMKVFNFDEHTAQEYLAMGATDVLAFGPVLVRDNVINEEVLKKHGIYNDPRVGIGIIDNNHYIAIVVEGRYASSKGTNTRTLAQMFVDLGCSNAFNLDGGDSANLTFMGKQLNHIGKKAKSATSRNTAEIFAIGHTEQLPLAD